MMRKRLVAAAPVLVAVFCLAAACTAPVEQGETVLTVSGAVENELELSQAELEDLGVLELTLEHPRKGLGQYEGVRISTVLESADPTGDTVKLVASDGYEYELPLSDLEACSDCLITSSEEGLDLAMSGMEGKAWVKDVVSIEVQ
jgi:hypothetical protein